MALAVERKGEVGKCGARASLCLLLALQIALCGCTHVFVSHAERQGQIPSDWQAVTVDKVTFYMPSNAKEIVDADTPPGARSFGVEGLRLNIGAGKTDSDAAAYLSHGESKLNEEEVLIDGRKALFTRFMFLFMDTGEQKLMALGIIKDVYAHDQPNFVMFARCKGPAEQELARKVFLTARVTN